MDILSFLNTSYTAYHAVDNAGRLLQQQGFVPLSLADKWTLQKGGRYYVVQGGSALIAWVVGEDGSLGWQIAAAHTDSPCLHIKGNTLPDSPQGRRLNTEVYGGLLLYSLLDIPLRIAGRVYVKQDNGIVPKVVASDTLYNIPSLCIHHNPDANKSLSLNAQQDMQPLVGDAKDVYSLVCDGPVVDADLYVVPAVQPFRSGTGGQWLCSPRIDDLTSVYASLQALIHSAPKGIAMACCFDNEEIGSGTPQGAQSALLCTVMQRIAQALGHTPEQYAQSLANSLLASVDNGHAVHPAHPEKSDPCEKVYMGKGIVVKHHTNYCTGGCSSAVFKAILAQAGVACQDYYNRSDIRCGSTLGSFVARQLGIAAVDIGLAQLAMHSAIETVAWDDIDTMQQGLTAFYNTGLVAQDGGYRFA